MQDRAILYAKDQETKPSQIQAKMTESLGLTSSWKTRPEVLSQSPKAECFTLQQLRAITRVDIVDL
jgi:hypothetical protein